MSVFITHPEVEGVGEVSEMAVAHYLSKGWELSDQQPAVDVSTAPGDDPKRPQKNDSTEAWRAYAVARHMPVDQAEEMGRDQLVAHYENTTPEEPQS